MAAKPLYSFGPRKASIIAQMTPIIATFGIPFSIVLSSGEPILATAIGLGSAVAFSGKSFFESMNLLFSKCNLYEDSVEYKTGWIKKSQRTIKYDSIVDVSFSQNAYERLLQHGKIQINTKGMDRKLEMKLINSPKKRYEMIKKVVNLSKNNPKLLEKFTLEKGPINIVGE